MPLKNVSQGENIVKKYILLIAFAVGLPVCGIAADNLLFDVKVDSPAIAGLNVVGSVNMDGKTYTDKDVTDNTGKCLLNFTVPVGRAQWRVKSWKRISGIHYEDVKTGVDYTVSTDSTTVVPVTLILKPIR